MQKVHKKYNISLTYRNGWGGFTLDGRSYRFVIYNGPKGVLVSDNFIDEIKFLKRRCAQREKE